MVSSKNTIISDSAKYTVAAIEKKPVDSKLYKEMSLLEEAYISIKAGDLNNAKTKLEQIDERSPLSMLARLLEHSTIKVK
jgi:outer membrane protein assembly factor BamD (BamD/ComL family)